MGKWDAVVRVRSGKRGRPKVYTERGFASRESAETFARNCVNVAAEFRVTDILITNVRVGA